MHCEDHLTAPCPGVCSRSIDPCKCSLTWLQRVRAPGDTVHPPVIPPAGYRPIGSSPEFSFSPSTVLKPYGSGEGKQTQRTSPPYVQHALSLSSFFFFFFLFFSCSSLDCCALQISSPQLRRFLAIIAQFSCSYRRLGRLLGILCPWFLHIPRLIPKQASLGKVGELTRLEGRMQCTHNVF